MRRNLTLQTKLTAAFLSVTLMLFLSISFFSNFLLESQFESYVLDKQKEKNALVYQSVQDAVSETGSSNLVASLEKLGVAYLNEGLMIRVLSQDQGVLWDAMTHNSGLCSSIITKMNNIMQEHHPGFKGAYTEKKYTLTRGTDTFGFLYIGYYGPYSYTEADVLFLNTLNYFMKISGVISSVFAVILGILFSRRLTKPLRELTLASHSLAEGEFIERPLEESNTKEIADLSKSFLHLSTKLKKQEALRKRLTADMAHELRTPLSSLKGTIEAMQDGIFEVDSNRLQSCHEEVVRLSTLISGLDQLSRYESENLTLKLESIPLRDFLSDLCLRLEALALEKGISLHLEGDDVACTADKDLLSQILINLLSNALKFTPDGGEITLSFAKEKKWIRISVKDTGIGIQSENLPYIFERFYREDSSRSRFQTEQIESEGSGIGLSIVKSLILAHNGKIEVESAPGQGSTFTLFFPDK